MKVTENRKDRAQTAFIQERRYITIITHDGTTIRLTCELRHSSQPWKVTWVRIDSGIRPDELPQAYRLALLACEDPKTTVLPEGENNPR